MGTAASDLVRFLLASPSQAYASVFAGEAFLFLVAAKLASRAIESRARRDIISVTSAAAV
jgi:MFS transporter, BCD family, chlorophyll transporter